MDGRQSWTAIKRQRERRRREGQSGSGAFVSFNGPLDGDAPTPSFLATGCVRNDALFSDPRLFIVPPDSDNGYIIEPKGQMHALEYQGSGG